MKGLTLKAAQTIERIVKSKFDSISMALLGLIPKKTKEKKIVFAATDGESLISLFLKALDSKDPNSLEEKTLKIMLSIAGGYIDSLRDKTAAKIVSEVNSYVQNQNSKTIPTKPEDISKIINKEVDKAKNHLQLIAGAESNKAINTGTALKIDKFSKEKGEDDPTVFFIVTQDDVTGFYEYVLHLLPDRKTPRLWKLSEVSAGYYKPGDQYPCLAGLHPNCRCKLTYLAKGYGFDASGRVKFISPDHDEFEVQRKEHGLPPVPEKAKKKQGQWVLP